MPIKGDKSGNKVGLEIDDTNTVQNRVKRAIYFKPNKHKDKIYLKKIKRLTRLAQQEQMNIEYL